MGNNKSRFSNLSPSVKRKFVPENADLRDVKQVEALYQKLIDHEVNSSKGLERWLFDLSELEAILDQTGSLLYIEMTCQTDDKEKAVAYKNFVENVIPIIEPLSYQLKLKYLESRKKYRLDDDRYSIFDKTNQTDVDLFIDKNVPLQTKVRLLAQEYQTIFGSMTVKFKDNEYTLPQMSKFLLETDRSVRQEAWTASSERRLMEKAKFEELFDQMLKIKSQIAENAGCKDYCEYQFRAYHRFDYTSEDCRQYHNTIEKIVVPVWKEILENRRKLLKLKRLRPWDTAVDPLGRPPLKPFTKIEELVAGSKDIFQCIDEDLGKQFSDMANLALLDLDSRKGKAPGGYQSVLAEARKPFIFMNAVGVDNDIWTLLHEGGHAFHALAGAQDPIFAYRHGPMEFCEVASMGMELLGSKHLNVFYNPEDFDRSNTSHFEDIVFTLVWVAIIDAFQQWIYINPKHNQKERKSAWLEIYNRFGGDIINWDGYEDQKSFLWHRQLHIFECPFYYIEYGIAQLGALQLWRNAEKDKKDAISQYRQGLSLGGSRPLPEIYEKAGLKFDFSENIIAPLIESVKKQIAL